MIKDALIFEASKQLRSVQPRSGLPEKCCFELWIWVDKALAVLSLHSPFGERDPEAPGNYSLSSQGADGEYECPHQPLQEQSKNLQLERNGHKSSSLKITSSSGACGLSSTLFALQSKC